MYIAPNTNIKLLKNVPLDTTYNHTIYFSSHASQASYFSSLAKYNLTEYSYQRNTPNKIRVGVLSDNIYDCNYLMYHNINFGDKWFYAFITNIEYINNSCSEITFEMDVMQTWFFDFQLKHCFVEREHTLTDGIGDHIEPEPVEVGEYVYNTFNTLFDLQDMAVLIADTKSYTNVAGAKISGIYSGARLWVYDVNDITNINQQLDNHISSPTEIVSVYMCPKIFFSDGDLGHLLTNYSAISTEQTEAQIQTTDSINGYVPKNKKLLTYPYNFYSISDGNGTQKKYRYEFFYNKTPVFRLDGTVNMPVSAKITPKGYKNNTSSRGSTTEEIVVTGFPVCSWRTNVYQTWSAQSTLPAMLTGGSNALATAVKTGGNPYAIGASVLGSVTSVLSQGYQASLQGNELHGNIQSPSLNIATNTSYIYGGRMSITAQYARMIDEFFSMYGYAINRVKIPQRSNRPVWNYVKTQGCVVVGSVPSDDMKQICAIHDKGITYWRNGSQVGNYQLDNSPS